MGCCGSSIKQFKVNDTFPGQDLEAYQAFQKLYLKDYEIDQMYTSFCKFDVNGSGEVSLIEFLAYLDLEETPITKEVFNDMDDSHDLQMNFREFVLNMWEFCTRSKASISTFAFDIFDDDDSGALNTDEITDMVKRIYGKKGLSHDIKLIIKKMDKNKDNNIDKKEFIACVNSFPALLFPAFHLQTTFREHVVNEKFWIEKQLQAEAIRRNPDVVELFRNRGKMAKRREGNLEKRQKQRQQNLNKNNKVHCDYDGVDLGAEMTEEQAESEHREAARHTKKRREIASEDDAARVIQAATIRKKNKNKREQKKKIEEETQHSAARVIQAASIRKQQKRKREQKKQQAGKQ